MKIDKIVFILLLSCLSFSCGRKETKERMKTYADAEKEFVGSLTKADSITVLEMSQYLQPIITQYFIDNKSEIWLLFLIAHSKR